MNILSEQLVHLVKMEAYNYIQLILYFLSMLCIYYTFNNNIIII